MKYLIISLFVLILSFFDCSGQNKSKKNTTKPQTEFKVNKEYDENGHLIRYDSTYTYFYSNIENDSLLEDSIFSNFKKHLNQKFSFSSNPFFDEFFFQDSLLHYNFYNNDFFTERFKQNHARFDKLFLDMDSIKNIFFKQQLKNR